MGHPQAERSMRDIDAIHGAPDFHWVGDGFHVAGYFSVIPNAMRRLSPFLMLDYHPPYDYTPTTQPRGVGVHPHRGFETVTFAWEGSVAHHDSTGAGGVIGPGDVQWMTAASGILHKEFHEEGYSRRGGPFHMAQLWVNLPRANKMSAPGYQAIASDRMGVVTLPKSAGTVRVIAGEFEGVRGPARTFTHIDVYDVRLNTAGLLPLTFPARHNLAVLVMKGEVVVNGGRAARTNDFILFKNEGERVDLMASSDAHLLVLSGEPIHEPIAAYGPFVMNSPDEIRQAMVDFNAGKFGHLDD
jgi:redox-sensitive bicupin YhaK (pirin superfamily)